MALLSTFLDKHYPHDEMVKQRKKQKGISAASSSELLPLKSILEVLLNKSMRPDPYVTIDDQVAPSSPPSPLPLPSPPLPPLSPSRSSCPRCAVHHACCAVVGRLRGAADQGRSRREGQQRQQQVPSRARRCVHYAYSQRCRIRLVDFLK